MALIRPSLRQPYQVTQEELDARAAQSYAQERTDNFLPFDIMAGADMSAANMAADSASARRIEAEIQLLRLQPRHRTSRIGCGPTHPVPGCGVSVTSAAVGLV